MFTPAFDEFLAKAGLTPAELARKFPVSENHISQMRSGRRPISPSIGETLVSALDISTIDAIAFPAEVAA